MTERDERSKKIQELIAERTKLRDDFNAQKREFQQHLAEQRRARQEKYAEERKKQQEEWKIKQLEKKVEQLDEQPYVSELTLIEQTVKFCKDLLPKEVGEKKEEKKDTEYNNKDGEVVLMIRRIVTRSSSLRQQRKAKLERRRVLESQEMAQRNLSSTTQIPSSSSTRSNLTPLSLPRTSQHYWKNWTNRGSASRRRFKSGAKTRKR